jgi:hypothetical protein
MCSKTNPDGFGTFLPCKYMGILTAEHKFFSSDLPSYMYGIASCVPYLISINIPCLIAKMVSSGNKKHIMCSFVDRMN